MPIPSLLRPPALLASILLLGLAGCFKPKAESQPLGSADHPLVMAFVPSTEAQGVMTSGEELSSLLAQQTGLAVKSTIATSYVSIVEGMGAGQIQLGWLPPVAYVFAHQRNGDEALFKVVRHGKPTYRGQVMVLADSPYKTLADLKGKRVAFPEQTSASGYYYPATLFKSAGIDPETDIQPSFAGGHDAALLALAHGDADAACGFEDIRTKVGSQVPDAMTRIRVLAYTPEIPADNVSAAAGLPADLRDKLRTGLAAVAASPEGQQILKQLYDIDGLQPVTDSDYAPVRAMMAALGQDPEAELKKADAARSAKASSTSSGAAPAAGTPAANPAAGGSAAAAPPTPPPTPGGK
jgi:phosphonate transport system substrate-binding protein